MSQRQLKNVTYNLIIGGREFSQTVPVYFYPRTKMVVIIEGYPFLILEERQDLDVYITQRYKEDVCAESIVAKPLVQGSQYGSIKEKLRSADTKGKWIESEIMTVIYADEMQKTETVTRVIWTRIFAVILTFISFGLFAFTIDAAWLSLTFIGFLWMICNVTSFKTSVQKAMTTKY